MTTQTDGGAVEKRTFAPDFCPQSPSYARRYEVFVGYARERAALDLQLTEDDSAALDRAFPPPKRQSALGVLSASLRCPRLPALAGACSDSLARRDGGCIAVGLRRATDTRKH